MDSVDLHKQVFNNIVMSRDYFRNEREEKRVDYDYYSGRQWTQSEASALEDQGRPAVVFNRCNRTINAVKGMEVQNRQEVRFFPRELRDNLKAELLTNAAKWARDNCDAEDEESEAFEDLLICGEGWTETRMNFDSDPDGEIIVERCDPLEMGADPTAKKRNYDDARYVFRIKRYSKAEFKAAFPGVEMPTKTSFNGGVDEEDSLAILNEFRNEPYSGDSTSSATERDTIEVAQYQYYEEEKKHAVQAPDGSVSYLSTSKLELMAEELLASGYTYTVETVPHRIYRQVIATGSEIIEESELECGFTFRAITGLRDRNQNTWFGLIRLMRDPQKWANKWMVQIQHILNSQAKSGKVAFETGALKNPSRAMEEWADPTKPVELNPGGLNKMLQLTPPAYPVGLDRLLAYALDAVNDAPGTNAEMLGLADRQQPGVLEQQRKQSGITIVATFFDAFRRYRKEQGRILAGYIRKYIADGRLIRITGETGEQLIPLIRDDLAMKYDIIVDDAPASPNVKEKTFAVLSQVFPYLQQAGVPIPPETIEYLPLPESLIGKFKDSISKAKDNPQAQMMQQMAMKAQMAEVMLKEAQAKKQLAEAEKAMSEIGAPLPDNTLPAAELQLKRDVEAAKIRLEAEKLQLEREKIGMAATPAATTSINLGGEEVGTAITALLGQISEQNAAALMAMAESQRAQNENLAASLSVAFQGLAQAMTAPKRLVKDENGKAIGVEVVGGN